MKPVKGKLYLDMHTSYWEWEITLRAPWRVNMFGNYLYKSEYGARRAAKRVAKRLGIELEES